MTRRSPFTPFAIAQAFGLALGFALALLTTSRLGYGLGLFLIGTAAAWLGWEFLFGKAAPSARRDPGAIAYAAASGFAFPWIGFALAALAALMRP